MSPQRARKGGGLHCHGGAINKTSIQVTSSSTTHGEKREAEVRGEEINTTFAVHFIRGHRAPGCGEGGVMDVEVNDHLLTADILFFNLIRCLSCCPNA